MRARATIATPGRCSRPGRAASSPMPSPAPVRRCATPRRDRRANRSRPRSSGSARWRQRCARSRRPARASPARSGSRTSRRSWPRRRRSTSRRRTPSWRATRSTRRSSSISRRWIPRRWRSSPTGCPPGRWPSSTSPRPPPHALSLSVVAPGGSFQVRSRAIAQEDLYKLVKEYRQYLDAATTERLPWVDDGSAVYREKVVPLREVSRKLSALLLEPVAPELATHRHLVLIPNDMLLYLPIHALTLADRDGSVRFLVETHVVSYVTQLELVDLLTPSIPEANVPLLAVATPDARPPRGTR